MLSFQIPCSVGPIDGENSASVDMDPDTASARDGNTFIIRDVPTPMLLPTHAAACSNRDASADGDSDGSSCSLVCKLRAAEVTGMGIPGKVWDAGLALSGSTAAPLPLPPCSPLTPFSLKRRSLCAAAVLSLQTAA